MKLNAKVLISKCCDNFALKGLLSLFTLLNNLFHILTQTKRDCVKDEIKLNKVKNQICQLPAQQFEGIKQGFYSGAISCPEPPSQKYHYDHTINLCVLRNFSGCFGTDNLFDSEDECLKFCADSINHDADQHAIEKNENQTKSE